MTTKRFKALLGTFYALDGAVFLYPVYLIHFRAEGLSELQVSLLLMLWPITSMLFELPSGVLADRMSKKRLLLAGQVMRIAGFGVWLALPTFTGFGIGLALWGLQGALYSGTLRAFVYEELEARGEAAAYTRILGRLNALKWATTILAYFVGPYIAEVGFPAVVAATCGVLALAVVALAACRARTGPADDGGLPALEFLRHAGREIAASRRVLVLILFGGAIVGLGSVDEYWPLFGRDAGLATRHVGLFYGGVMLAQLLGDLVAWRLERLGLAWTGAVVLASGGLLIAAAWGAGGLLSLALVGGFALGFQASATALNGTLQHGISSTRRATIMSVQGLLTGLGSIAFFGLFGVVSETRGLETAFGLTGVGFAAAALALVAAAALMPSLRARRPGG